MARRTQSQAKSGFSIIPKGASSCVVVFHEVWGLVGHTKDLCKRIGKLGFAAVAPNLFRGYEDLLTPDNIQETMEGVWELSLEERRDKKKVIETLAKKGVSKKIMKVASVIYDAQFRNRLLAEAIAAVDRAHSKFGGVATLGFCIGGGLSMKVAAARSRQLKSAISFYGEPPVGPDLKAITIPVLAIYANKDEIINLKVPAFVGAMLDGGKDLTLKTYPRTVHGFFNDTRKSVYNRRAADESWEITKWFLDRTLGKH